MDKGGLQTLTKPFFGLQAKACLALTVIVAATAGVIGVTSFRKARTQMTEAAATQTLHMARMVATAAYDCYKQQDTAALMALSQRLISDNTLLYVAFVDPDGRVKAAAQKPQTLSTLLDGSGQNLKDTAPGPIRLRQFPQGQAALEAWTRIEPAETTQEQTQAAAGMLLLAANLEPLRANLRAMARRIVELTSAVAIGVIAVGFFVMRRLVGPINKLADASLDLAYRHEFRRLTTNRHDELGRLTQAFNHMADRLLRTQRELLELNSELERRVALRTVELEARNRQLNRIASRDSLTGLYNRRHFNELLAREAAEALRYGHDLTCMMLDLDNFKRVNDALGHQAGDTVLRQVADVICREIRQADLAARYGGDEFIVLLPQCNATQAFHLAKRIRQAAQEALSSLGPDGPFVSLSIGLADMHLSGARDGEALVRAADEALYKVKSAGKDGISYAKPGPVQAA